MKNHENLNKKYIFNFLFFIINLILLDTNLFLDHYYYILLLYSFNIITLSYFISKCDFINKNYPSFMIIFSAIFSILSGIMLIVFSDNHINSSLEFFYGTGLLSIFVAYLISLSFKKGLKLITFSYSLSATNICYLLFYTALNEIAFPATIYKLGMITLFIITILVYILSSVIIHIILSFKTVN